VDFVRAFSYPFDDRQWVEKLVVTGIMALASIIPLVGLVTLAALFGWVVELIANMRRGQQNPMPRWDNMGEKIGLGLNVLLAWIVYGLPNILLVCCAASIPLLSGAGRSDFFAGSFAFGLVCCLVPLVALYNIIIFPMMALGTIHYSETRQVGVFFQFGDLLGTISDQIGIFTQWLLLTFFASLVIGLVGAIPCLGWVATLALSFPVYGHLIGQLGMALKDRRKSKPKRYNV
jgi:hypothetical protein